MVRRPDTLIDRLLRWATWSWLGAALSCWAAIAWYGERWLPATLLLYGPRYVLPLPGLLLVPFVLWRSWRLIFPLAAATMIMLVPVAGWNVPFGRLRGTPSVSSDQTVRVVTYNVRGGQLVAQSISQLMDELRPDIFAAQECQDELFAALQELPNRYADRDRRLCVSSRWPIRLVEAMPNQEILEARIGGFGGAGIVSRFTIETPLGALPFITLHLETARKGLRTVLSKDRSGSAIQAMGNSLVREAESRRARAFFDQLGDVPRIVAGDFNIPVESPIYQRHWGDLHNAFGVLGTGFGWTKQEGSWIRIRIDHALAGGGLRAKEVRLGRDYGSDHLPLLSVFAWPTAK